MEQDASLVAQWSSLCLLQCEGQVNQRGLAERAGQ